MKFKLTTTKTFYNNDEKKEYEKIGFEFEYHKIYDKWSYMDMFIEFNTIQEFTDFANKIWDLFNVELIVNIRYSTIEIYNDWRE